MTIRAVLGWTALVAGLGAGGYYGYEQWQGSKAAVADARPDIESVLDAEQPETGVTTIDVSGGADPSFGATPMAQRVAVLGLLNKRNGVARDITLKPGQAVRVGDVIVRLSACERTAPWEQQPYTGAFVQLDIQDNAKVFKRVFSGWLYKERPGLNVVLHPVYDVWPKSCAMTFPEGGPNTVKGGGEAKPGTPRLSAKKSPEAADDAASPAPITPSIAAESNAT